MSISVGDRFITAWKSDAIRSSPTGTPSHPIPSTPFPVANFQYIFFGPGSNSIGDIHDNLRLPGTANQSYYAGWVPPNNLRLSYLSGVDLGKPALWFDGPVYTGTIDPDYAYRPTQQPGDSLSFLYLGIDNLWKWQKYDFSLATLGSTTSTEISYDLTSSWVWNSNIPPVATEFSTDTDELGGSETIVYINDQDQPATANMNLFLKSMQNSLLLEINDGVGGNVWEYDINSWTVNAGYQQLSVTLTTSTLYINKSNGNTYNIVVKFRSANNTCEMSGYTWAGDGFFYVAPNDPKVLFQLTPSTGTCNPIVFWDQGGYDPYDRIVGYSRDQCTIACLPREDKSLYVNITDQFVAATFNDSSNNERFNVMNTGAGTNAVTAQLCHKFIKSVPKCQNLSDHIFLVSYGPSATYTGITIFEIDSNGSLVSTINDAVGVSATEVNQIEFYGYQYGKAVSDASVWMLVSSDTGEYKINFNPAALTITPTYVSGLIGTANPNVIIRCIPDGNDNRGIFLMAKCDGTSSDLYWINLDLQSDFSPPGGNSHTSSIAPRYVNWIGWNDNADWNNGFTQNENSNGWIIATESDQFGNDGGPHHVPGTTGSTLSSYKEGLSIGAHILTGSNHDHTATIVYSAGNPNGERAAIYGDTTSTYWKVSRAYGA